jgi:lysophospholipase L1-like esterase
LRENTAVLSTKKKVVFSLLITIFLFLAPEGLFRICGFSFAPERLQWGAEWGVWEDPAMPWSWIPKPGATCHLDRIDFQWNQLGYRGPVFEPKKEPGTLRIVCLGDSVTMGWFVPDDKTYCFQLQELLRGQLPQAVETINGGVMAYTSYQGLHELQTRILDLQPDVITISYNWNDHFPAKKKIQDKDLSSGMTSFQFLSKLRIFQFIEYVMVQLNRRSQATTPQESSDRTEGEDGPVRVSLKDYRKNLIRMIEVAQEHNITPILVTEPCGAEWRTGINRAEIEKIGRKQPAYNREYNQVMKKLADEKGIVCIDLVPVFREKQPHFFDTIHPAAAGHLAIAAEIARVIKARHP